MTIKIELPSKGNWINWDLYSEKAMSPEEQEKNLNIIREELKKHITEAGEKGYMYLLDLKLYQDKLIDRIFKLYANLGVMPVNNFNEGGYDFKHNIVAGGGGGEAALANVPIRPVGPKGHFFGTPFVPILNETRFNLGLGTLINIK